MKKMLSLILVALMLTTTMASCTTLEGKDRGAIIDMYLGTEVYDFDPQKPITDDAQLRYMTLMYEGLTRLDENGKWVKAMMQDYRVEVNDDDDFSIIVDLGGLTCWSDGRTVQAIDFVYSWKRLLDPEAQREGASLLYDIKNAKAAKLGDASIDDVGVAAVDTYVLQIVFEGEVDLDNFFEKCASIALVPLREDMISRIGEKWSTKTTTILSNGPFVLREIAENGQIALGRSAYYYLDQDPDSKEPLDKYVIPYRLVNRFTLGDEQAQLDAYNSGELGSTIYLDNNLPLAERAALKKDAEVTDMMATHTYVFNTENELFAKPEVRRALSLAIDRDAIVEMITFAKPATGYVPYKVFDAKSRSSFREEGGDLIATSANLEEAKTLLKNAGVSGGSFTITVRDNEVDMAVADYIKGVWETLGFTVKIDSSLGLQVSETGVTSDLFQDAYLTGDFDVIAVDTMMQSADAFNILSQFAAAYSGNGADMASSTYDVIGHISGYNSEAYNALIDSANAEYDRAARTAILHDAEKMLLEDMPVCPVYFLQDAYIVSDELTGVDSDYYGMRNFNGAKLNDYMTKKAATDTSEDTTAS
ncbi:MAG: peptide ABC transporter substrate-binding protein [Clostridia bacterium]|nr:peptide ABC transporter substrate-binding protein [Clostridia bacterium]